MTARRAAQGAAVAAAVAVLPAAAVVLYPPARLGAAVLFCLLAPGSGWAWRLARTGRIRRADRLAVALVLSICATMLVGTAMAAAGRWSTAGGMALLGVVAAAGYAPWGRWWARAVPLRRRARHRLRRRSPSGGAREPE